MPDVFFENFEPGTVSRFGRYRVDRDEMVDFARAFDPQPFHLDEQAAAASPVGRLIASGWYSCAVHMRLICDEWLVRASSLGGPGVDELLWLRPVVAGDVLSVRQTILDRRVSATRPEMGLVRFRAELLAGEDVVMRLVHLGMFGLRSPARDAPPRSAVRAPSGIAEAPPVLFPPEDPASAPRSYEAAEPGRGYDLGTYTFTAERIRDFARRYDTQGFHLDDDAAAAGPFGGLAASGWHTGAAWMSCFAARLTRLAETGDRPRIGVSPGFRDLRWLKPVYAGDVIRYAAEPIEKRPSASRPGWGLLTSRNSGWNGRGEKVLEFTSSAFWQMEGR